MKTRLGFVSNSSSSSFVIGLKAVPKTAEELHKMLWGDEPQELQHWDYTLASPVAAAVAFGQIVIQSGKMTQKEIFEEIIHGYFEDYPHESWNNKPSDKMDHDFRAKYNKSIYDYDEDNAEESKAYTKFDAQRKKEWKQHDRDIKTAAKKYWDKNKARFKGKKLFLLSFSDNDSQAHALMEHGNVFGKVPNIQISHH
jgi:hypothetical protein